MKLRLLCSQVLKELLGQGIDVSTGLNTPLSDNLMRLFFSLLGPWISPFFSLAPTHSYHRIWARGKGLVTGLWYPLRTSSPHSMRRS